MATYLDLVALSMEEAGVQQEIPATQTDFDTPIGDTAKFKRHVKRAWEEIQQGNPDWNFWRDEDTFTVSEGVYVYDITDQIPTYDNLITYNSGRTKFITGYTTGVEDPAQFKILWRDWKKWRIQDDMEMKPQKVTLEPVEVAYTILSGTDPLLGQSMDLLIAGPTPVLNNHDFASAGSWWLDESGVDASVTYHTSSADGTDVADFHYDPSSFSAHAKLSQTFTTAIGVSYQAVVTYIGESLTLTTQLVNIGSVTETIPSHAGAWNAVTSVIADFTTHTTAGFVATGTTTTVSVETFEPVSTPGTRTFTLESITLISSGDITLAADVGSLSANADGTTMVFDRLAIPSSICELYTLTDTKLQGPTGDSFSLDAKALPAISIGDDITQGTLSAKPSYLGPVDLTTTCVNNQSSTLLQKAGYFTSGHATVNGSTVYVDATNSIGDNDSGQPRKFTLDPDGLMRLTPVPDGDYIFSLEYHPVQQELSAYDDVVSVPNDYKMVVVYRTLMLHYAYDERGSAYRNAQKNYRDWKMKMSNEYLPETDLKPRELW